MEAVDSSERSQPLTIPQYVVTLQLQLKCLPFLRPHTLFHRFNVPFPYSHFCFRLKKLTVS